MQTLMTRPISHSTLDSARYAQYQAALDACPAELGSVFARMQPSAEGLVQWCSPLAGAVRPFSQLSVVEQQHLLMLFAERKAMLSNHADALVSREQIAAAQNIIELLALADVSCLYSVGQQPVLVDWYGVDGITAPKLNSTDRYVAADNAATAMAAGAARMAALKNKQTGQGWLWWLLVLPLLALLLAQGLR